MRPARYFASINPVQKPPPPDSAPVGTWRWAEENGHVASMPDAAHPIATQAQGNPAPLFVSREYVTARFRALHYAGTRDVDQMVADKFAELDAGKRVRGHTAEYWIPTAS